MVYNLGFRIGTKWGNCTEDHPNIIHTRNQIHRHYSFWEEEIWKLTNKNAFWALAAMLNYSIYWSAPNEENFMSSCQWTFVTSLVQFDPMISEKKMFYADDDDTDGRKVMTIAHMGLWPRWANDVFPLESLF
jgi:hypothetical protein